MGKPKIKSNKDSNVVDITSAGNSQNTGRRLEDAIIAKGSKRKLNLDRRVKRSERRVDLDPTYKGKARRLTIDTRTNRKDRRDKD
jgi:hypothetical protein